MKKTIRLILGDQLNSAHSWFNETSEEITYVLMEIRTETDYATHHIQKVLGFFASMRNFAKQLEGAGHNVIYLSINDKDNQQDFAKNLKQLIDKHSFAHFEYQLPDEFRVDEILKQFCQSLAVTHDVIDTEHFYTSRSELGEFYKGKLTFIMENFYHAMRKKHDVLMEGQTPVNGQWNYDSDNRKKIPKEHKPLQPLVFENDLSAILKEVDRAKIKTIGTVDAKNFLWPTSPKQSLQLMEHFMVNCLPLFGSYQDAMVPTEWSLYHSRLSFSMNLKMISPREVINRAIKEWNARPDEIEYNQLEGFVRQIIGWREYMRGIYWLKMPEFATLNYLNNKAKLPDWYWTGNTKMHCLRDSIQQTLTYSYAHHIQRLMITGNFALLAGTDPDEVSAWYLGVYIDAIEWVEITNTVGMSQFADGGIVGTKPYVSSASYIDKMSHYCGSCYYKKSVKTGDKACPFNSLYWNFFDKNADKLQANPRLRMVYALWKKMKPDAKVALLEQADYYLKNINKI